MLQSHFYTAGLAVYITLELTMRRVIVKAALTACVVVPLSVVAIITAVGPVRTDIPRRIESQKTLLGAGAGATLPPHECPRTPIHPSGRPHHFFGHHRRIQRQVPRPCGSRAAVCWWECRVALQSRAPNRSSEGVPVSSNRSFDTDAQRRAFASLRSFPPVAGQL